jgi:hypothetical protein
MSHVNTINKGLDTAFRSLKDLVVFFSFVPKAQQTFDFVTREASTVAAIPVELRGVILKKERTETEVNKMKLLFKTTDIPDVSIYSSVTYNNQTWHIAPKIESGVFTTLLEVYR